MRIYLDGPALGAQLARQLELKRISQTALAAVLKVNQGEVSKIVQGRFKTENPLVKGICKYVNIDPSEFRRLSKTTQARSESVKALSLACKGQPARERAVVRILRALQELD